MRKQIPTKSLMLLGCSVNTSIHDCMFHLLALRCALRRASCVNESVNSKENHHQFFSRYHLPSAVFKNRFQQEKPLSATTKKGKQENKARFLPFDTSKKCPCFLWNHTRGQTHTGRARVMPTNGTCCCQWECSHYSQATPKEKRSNLYVRRV